MRGEVRVGLSTAFGVVAGAFVVLALAAWNAGNGHSNEVPEPAFSLFVAGVVLFLWLTFAVLLRWPPFRRGDGPSDDSSGGPVPSDGDNFSNTNYGVQGVGQQFNIERKPKPTARIGRSLRKNEKREDGYHSGCELVLEDHYAASRLDVQAAAASIVGVEIAPTVGGMVMTADGYDTADGKSRSFIAPPGQAVHVDIITREPEETIDLDWRIS